MEPVSGDSLKQTAFSSTWIAYLAVISTTIMCCVLKLKSWATCNVVWEESEIKEFTNYTNELASLILLSPDSQVVLSCVREGRDIAAISTESSHQWGFLRIAIPHLNVVWWCTIAIYIQWDNGDVDICSVGLRDEVYTVCQFWVLIWEWRRG